MAISEYYLHHPLYICFLADFKHNLNLAELEEELIAVSNLAGAVFIFQMTLRSAYLEVLIDGHEWHRVGASLDETALILASLNDGFTAGGGESELPLPLNFAAASYEKRFVRVIKPEGQGLGISIQVQ